MVAALVYCPTAAIPKGFNVLEAAFGIDAKPKSESHPSAMAYTQGSYHKNSFLLHIHTQ